MARESNFVQPVAVAVQGVGWTAQANRADCEPQHRIQKGVPMHDRSTPAVTDADIEAAREYIAGANNRVQLASALRQLRREVVAELVSRGMVARGSWQL